MFFARFQPLSWLCSRNHKRNNAARVRKQHRIFPCIEPLEDRMLLAANPVILVTTATDNGNNAAPTPGSLRAAIIKANDTAGSDTIQFDIKGSNGPTMIDVANTPLPAITERVVIDGATKFAANPNQTIIITTTNKTPPASLNGLTFAAGSNTSKVYGLTISGFYDGILVKGANSIQIGLANGGSIKNGQGCMTIINNTDAGIDLKNANNCSVIAPYIGTNANSTTGIGNAIGVFIEPSSTGSHIGQGNVGDGKVPDGLNVISGNNKAGILIWANNNYVAGNYVGTTVNGLAALKNAADGVDVLLNDSNNTIGGPAILSNGLITTPANVISGNGGAGVYIQGGNDNSIQGNFIGTDATGKAALANGKHGIAIQGNDNVVGGSQTDLGNVISGNARNGILVGALDRR